MNNDIKQTEYTPKERLEIRGSIIYIVIVSIMTFVATILQPIGGFPIEKALRTTIAYSFVIFLAFLIYRKKKKKEKATVLIWVVAFLTTVFALYARYNYALEVS